MSENMKPCPWCGQTDKLEIETSNTEFVWVTCTRCGILGPQHGCTRELAIGCWNSRMRNDDLAEVKENNHERNEIHAGAVENIATRRTG